MGTSDKIGEVEDDSGTEGESLGIGPDGNVCSSRAIEPSSALPWTRTASAFHPHLLQVVRITLLEGCLGFLDVKRVTRRSAAPSNRYEPHLEHQSVFFEGEEDWIE